MLDMELYPYEGRRPRVYRRIYTYSNMSEYLHMHMKSEKILLSLLLIHSPLTDVDARNLCYTHVKIVKLCKRL